jgi:hypothetical protein
VYFFGKMAMEWLEWCQNRSARLIPTRAVTVSVMRSNNELRSQMQWSLRNVQWEDGLACTEIWYWFAYSGYFRSIHVAIHMIETLLNANMTLRSIDIFISCKIECVNKSKI